MALIVTAALATTGIASAAPRRMLLVSIDGLSTGAARSDLPELTALAATGVRCDVLAPGPEPFPTWVELLSGCEPARTRVWDETAAIPIGVADRWPSLAGSLTAAGWHALALPADPLAHAGTPLAHGFERYDAASPALAESARVDTALAWLGRPGRRFAWLALSLGLPGDPWRRVDGVLPSDGAARAARRGIVDAALARLSARLAALNRDGTTCVVVAGTGSADGASTRVPLVFTGAATRGLETGGVLHLADVAPTLVAIAGARATGFDGIDLASPRSAGARAARPPRRELRADTLALPAVAREAFMELAGEPGRVDSTRLAAWDRLCERFPSSARLALERALAQSRGGREAVAARTLKAMTAAMSEDARPALAYADHLMRYGRTSIAAEVLGVVDPRSPFAAPAHWRRAIAHASEEDFLAAEGDARRAAQLATPNDAAAGLPQRLHALAALHDSCTRAPREAETRLRYGRALGEFGLFAPAYKQFHAARALAPASAEPDYWLAFYLLREGRPQNAQPTLERALARDSTYAPARHALAEALLEQGKRADGRAQLERLAARDNLDAREWYNLACLRSGDGADDPALDALNRAIAAGYSDWEAIATDADLARLRSNPRFPTAPAR